MNMRAARSELSAPPRIKLSVLAYEVVAVFMISAGLMLLLD